MDHRIKPIAHVCLAGALGWLTLALWPPPLLAQTPETPQTLWTVAQNGGPAVPTYWFVLASGLALLVPAGLTLVAVSGLEPGRAWDAALGGVAAMGLAALGYWAVGFAFHFGGVGLVYDLPGLRDLVWEWSPFPSDWGTGWGMAGLSGWFLAGRDVTPLTYALFLAHLPWVLTAAILPNLALRGRAPVTATLVLPLLMGGFIYPLAGNWVRGGGWLGALGRNLNLGHGMVDFGGAGTVHLVAAGVALAALVVWVPRRPRRPVAAIPLPPAQLPLLAVAGSLLFLAGSLGWLWSNPLQVSALQEVALLRGSVNLILFACGGVLVPLIYTWFVTGTSSPVLSARGLTAGVVAGLAVGPFVQPAPAFLIGFLAGLTVPFVTFLVDAILRLDDATGTISVSGIPAMVGLLLLAIFADGTAGQGWHMTGVESYLGVTGQGVSGLFVAPGYQIDFPGQLQAQIIGILTLGLWGILVGMLICAPLGLLLYSLRRSSTSVPDEVVLATADGVPNSRPPDRPDSEPLSTPSLTTRANPSVRQET